MDSEKNKNRPNYYMLHKEIHFKYKETVDWI